MEIGIVTKPTGTFDLKSTRVRRYPSGKRLPRPCPELRAAMPLRPSRAAAALLFALACGCAAPPAARLAADPPAPLQAGVAATVTPPSDGVREPDPVDEPHAPRALRAVRPGLEVLLEDSAHLVRGRRVGFITNHTSIASDGRSGIDILHESPDVDLVALFAPEHGIRGIAHGGVHIADGRDVRTGVRILSLYGRTQKPTPEMLRGIDVLLFDIQDVGARPYTYVWTMAMAMEAAAEAGIPFVVLDRPNPITDRIEGPLMQFEMRNQGQAITGYYPVPMRHGMTVAEVARYVNEEFQVGARLHVMPADGWFADSWFDQTALPWVDPSPNIRSLDAALTYSGLVILEAVNLSVGRGTDLPFFYVGAPWLDDGALLARLDEYRLPGVRFERARYVPRGDGWVPFRDREVRAVRLHLTDREAYLPVLTALVLLSEIHRLHPRDVGIGSMLQMLGSRWAREALVRGDDPREIHARWNEENARWAEVRERYRLYPRNGAIADPRTRPSAAARPAHRLPGAPDAGTR
jgi:uncharacterized protein YbbC (DUF1343 family)